jgi:hypothetical protein
MFRDESLVLLLLFVSGADIAAATIIIVRLLMISPRASYEGHRSSEVKFLSSKEGKTYLLNFTPKP